MNSAFAGFAAAVKSNAHIATLATIKRSSAFIQSLSLANEF
jgi:hypothetical protein